jgi:hypothetical protein
MTKLGNQPSTPSEQNSISVISPVAHAKFTLSGAGTSNGPITLASGSGNPTTIHQCGNNGIDEVYLWCFASGSVNTKVYVAVDDVLVLANDITSEAGLVQIYPGVPHKGSAITAWANIAGTINMMGYVIRHYPIADYNADLGFDGTE